MERSNSRITMALPKMFQLDLRSPEPTDQVSADLIAQALFDRPPPWVEEDWTTELEVMWELSPRHKARSSISTNPTRARFLRAMAKPRPGEVFATGLRFSPPPSPDDYYVGRTTFQNTLWRTYFHEDVTAWDVGETGLRNAAFGPWALDFVSTVLAVAPPCRPSASWFGSYGPHPYVHDLKADGLLPGYGWLVTLPSSLSARLDPTVPCPAALRSTVVTPSGDEVQVMVLTEAPSQVTDDLLREWRTYLAPVLPPNRLAERTEMYDRIRHNHPHVYDLPPMMLSDDWPIRPSG